MADWIMKGLPADDPLRIRSADALTAWIQEKIGRHTSELQSRI